MGYRIGLPRALLYHEYSVLWHTFFNHLDVEVITSRETNKSILDRGAAKTVDEACLPVKVFFGHLADLSAQKVDGIFVPRLVRVEEKAYICPKVIGLPDMARATKTTPLPLLSPSYDFSSPRQTRLFYEEIGSFFGYNKAVVKKAWEKGLAEQARYESRKAGEKWPFAYRHKAGPERIIILVLGHPYLLHDCHLNMNLLKKIESHNCSLFLPEHFSRESLSAAVTGLPKRLFWTFGKILLGSALCFADLPGTKGVVILSSFGCGIDSFINNMVMRRLKNKRIPYLNITLDEHTGEAGVDTRLEAFIDMLHWRRDKDENYFPAYGQHLDSRERNAGIYWT